MPVTLEQFGLDTLSVADRLELIDLLQDSVAGEGEPVSVPDWHWPIIAERIARADANPEANIPLEDLRRELLGGP